MLPTYFHFIRKFPGGAISSSVRQGISAVEESELGRLPLPRATLAVVAAVSRTEGARSGRARQTGVSTGLKEVSTYERPGFTPSRSGGVLAGGAATVTEPGQVAARGPGSRWGRWEARGARHLDIQLAGDELWVRG